MAEIEGSTYDFTASSTPHTVVTSNGGNGTYTDPANNGFCVGPPNDCANGQGMAGRYSFTNISPTEDQIDFHFLGNSDLVGGQFTIDLGNFVTTDGSAITDVTYDSGNLELGDFSNVVWNGSDAIFTGTSGGSSPGQGTYNARHGVDVLFDVTETAAATPEPSSLLLGSLGLVGLVIAGMGRKPHHIT